MYKFGLEITPVLTGTTCPVWVAHYDRYIHTGQEAWRKRIYPKSFVSKLNDSEGEAAETQVWLDYALQC